MARVISGDMSDESSERMNIGTHLPTEPSICSPEEYWLGVVDTRLQAIVDGSSAEELLRHELAAMQLAECAIRRRQNALKPISSLPPEIIIAVFHSLQWDIDSTPASCREKSLTSATSGGSSH
ncbi:hypothetical protein OF83DRAFT_1179614 [Amylostereum chailletii]|nr:hypothetical protein OF83DRAFT_1179614 [Amylostereum chailletii]